MEGVARVAQHCQIYSIGTIREFRAPVMWETYTASKNYMQIRFFIAFY